MRGRAAQAIAEMARFVVHEEQLAGPSTHVLLIGVGKYPHLIGGEAPCQNADGMGQLTSPPISARAVAAWFISEYNDQNKKLASVALLLSEQGPRPFRNPKTGESHEVEVADGDNAEEAIRQWKDRANSDAGNRLFFYFCGHGVCEGDDMALLTSDFCAEDDNPLQGAINFRLLTGGLKKCRASQQVFFIDACRANSDVLIGSSEGFAGRVPLLPGRRPSEFPHRLLAPFYSTLSGEKSYARTNSISLFTEALLKSLRGAASDDPEGDWRVTTTRLQEAIDHFMKQPMFAGEIAGVQVPVTGELPVFELHYLTGEPEIPVYIGCEPRNDNARAEFVCMHAGAQKARRTVAEVDPADPLREWSLPLTYGEYEFRAEFGPGGISRSRIAMVRPVFRRIPLRAGQ